MLNNLILLFLLVCLIIGICYVFLRLKEETTSKSKKGGEHLQISQDEVLEQTESLILAGDIGTAQKLAKKYLCQNPYHHDLRKLLIKSYIETQNEYEAISNLLVLTQFYPDDLSLYIQLANLYKITHQSKKAIHFFTYVLSKNKYDLNAMKNLA